jgi:Mg-chelatase subunit ChlI
MLARILMRQSGEGRRCRGYCRRGWLPMMTDPIGSGEQRLRGSIDGSWLLKSRPGSMGRGDMNPGSMAGHTSGAIEHADGARVTGWCALCR